MTKKHVITWKSSTVCFDNATSTLSLIDASAFQYIYGTLLTKAALLLF